MPKEVVLPVFKRVILEILHNDDGFVHLTVFLACGHTFNTNNPHLRTGEQEECLECFLEWSITGSPKPE